MPIRSPWPPRTRARQRGPKHDQPGPHRGAAPARAAALPGPGRAPGRAGPRARRGPGRGGAAGPGRPGAGAAPGGCAGPGGASAQGRWAVIEVLDIREPLTPDTEAAYLAM